MFRDLVFRGFRVRDLGYWGFRDLGLLGFRVIGLRGCSAQGLEGLRFWVAGLL